LLGLNLRLFYLSVGKKIVALIADARGPMTAHNLGLSVSHRGR
jgi:hypothetical protein